MGGGRPAWDCKCFLCAVAAWASTALADPPRVILSNISTSATSNVPGDAGWQFNTGILADGVFRRFVLSASGGRWAVSAVARSGALTQQVIVTGSGPATTGATRVVRAGLPTFFDVGRTWENLDATLGVNDAGAVCFGANASGASGDDEVVARWTPPNTFTLFAREGQQAPGLAAGVGFGAADDGVHMWDGGVRFRSAVLPGSVTKHAVFSLTGPGAGVVLAETDVSAPSGQLVLPAQTLDAIMLDRIASDSAGAHLLCIADLNGPTSTDLAAILDDVVIAQEGAAIAGSGVASAVSGFSTDAASQRLSPGGSHWLLRGAWANLDDWVLLDGGLYARTGDLAVSGGVDVFDDGLETETFIASDVNDEGNVVLAGAIASGNTFANEVVVMDRQFPAFREGDGVDVNGNGEADDNAFIAAVAPGGLALTNDRRLYAVVGLRNDAGSGIGAAVITLRVGCSDIDFNNDGVFPDFTDLLDFLNVFAGAQCPTASCDSIDFNNDNLFPDIVDLEAFLRVFGGGAC